MRVLIAEDDRVSRRLLQRQIEQWGHEVVSTENGREAWNHFCNDSFSIVVSDWMMPEMDGLELVRRIRGSHQAGYVYVILLTAKTEKDDLVRGMEAGADDFLTKPFDRNELRVRFRAGERIIQLERNLAERNNQLQAVNQRMTRDLEAAASVQRSLLPAALLPIPGIEFAWSFRPCDELAGDFLNVLPLDERHVAVYVADVSGHGVVASLLAVAISRLLTPQTSASSVLVQAIPGSSEVRIIPPIEVAKELNRRFQMSDKMASYFSLVYGVLDIQTHQLRYVSAGHPPILRLARDGQMTFLPGDGYAIGWDTDVEYDEQVVELKPKDRLWIYSDGVPEAMNGKLELFGEARLQEACQRQHSQALPSAVQGLLKEVEQWCGPSGPRDDVSILAIEIEEVPPL